MGAAIAHRLDGPEDSRKDLAVAAHFHSWFDQIANPGDAHLVPWAHHGQRRRRDSSIAENYRFERGAIDFQQSVLIAERPAQADFFYREICQFESHWCTRSPSCSV